MSNEKKTATEITKAVDQRIYALDEIAVGDYEGAFKQTESLFFQRQSLARAMLSLPFAKPIKSEYLDCIDYFNETIIKAFSLGKLIK